MENVILEPFKTYTGIVAVLDRENIDTDQIISKEFLKSIRKTGFGEHLFHHWRFGNDGSLEPDFELNNPRYRGASILITGNNFGCGSSREHAVWAVMQFGFRTVIAPQKKSGKNVIPAFADIFSGNSAKNGLLLIEMPEEKTREMVLMAKPGIVATIDLKSCRIIFHDPQKEVEYTFAIDENLKNKLLEGLDEIGEIEKHSSLIASFEKIHSPQMFSNHRRT